MSARLSLCRKRGNADGEDVLEVLLKQFAVSGWVIESVPLVDHHRPFARLASTVHFRDNRFGRTICGDLLKLILIRLGEISELVDLFVDERQAENIDQGVKRTEKPGQSSVNQKILMSDCGQVSAMAKYLVHAGDEVQNRKGRIKKADNGQRHSALENLSGITPEARQRLFRP